MKIWAYIDIHGVSTKQNIFCIFYHKHSCLILLHFITLVVCVPVQAITFAVLCNSCKVTNLQKIVLILLKTTIDGNDELYLRPCHTIAYRTSVCQRMKNITHTPVTLTYARGTLGIGCIRFKHGRIRWHTLAYGDAGIFLSMVKNLVRIRTYGLYGKHIL
jgi:hypothetical protein